MQILRLKKAEPVEKKIRTCAYCRVSSLSDMQEMSLENQMATYDRLIKSNPEYEFVKIYYDQGTSGSKENRKGLNEMLNDARKGLFDLIITKSVSRFARNTVTVLKYVRELKEIGIGVIFEDNNINTLSSDGEMMLSVLSSLAQEELRSMSNNLKWSIHRQYESGNTKIKYQGMYGYYIDEYGNLAINEEQAKIVKRVFSMYLSGMSGDRIAENLNEEKIPTYKNKQWSSRTVLDMLKNEKYKGDFLLQKYYCSEPSVRKRNKGEVASYYICENHEPIINPKEWDKVQKLIAEKRKKRNIKDTEKYCNRYPLSGMLLCPHCGSTLRRKQVHNKRIEWWCSRSIEKGVSACKGIHVKDEDVSSRNITEQTVVEEMIINGKKCYSYTTKAEYANRSKETECKEIKSSSLLQSQQRQRRTAIKL